jgi:hypothetical protein
MFWKRKTDEEFVEILRKVFFGWSKPWAAVHVLVSSATAILAFILLQKIDAVDFLFGEDFALGFGLGAIAGLAFFAVVSNALMALIIFFRPRSIRLMIEYHDRLQAMEKQSPLAGDLTKTD